MAAKLCLPVYCAGARLRDVKSARPPSAHQRWHISSSSALPGRANSACTRQRFIAEFYGSHSLFPCSVQGTSSIFAASAATSDQEVIFGNRIPQHYFATKGFGDTDEGAGEDPWETGSYDLALQAAGIENFNIQTYTSVVPPEAIQLTLADAKPYFKHGAVLECIMASMNGHKGDRISAGVGTAKVRKIDDNALVGGFAAEYRGNCSAATIQETLLEDLQGIFKRRFDASSYEMYDHAYVVEVDDVSKSYGTVLASICFISFINPSFVIPSMKSRS